jgi:hydrogenase nickel incorporation protein HypA/HybF
MHELSIAVKLVELSCEHASAYDDAEIAAIHIAIGVLAQVHEGSLRSGFEIAREGTAAAGADLVIRSVPLVIACTDCDRDFQIEGLQDLRCPRCHGDATQVRSGNELDLESIALRPRSPERSNEGVVNQDVSFIERV